jgi:AraC-like DNA-binding protein
MQLDISTDEMPERDRLDVWRSTIFDTMAITVERMPGAEGPYQGRFTARSSGPLLNCRFDADGFRAVRQSRELAHRRWDGYRIYREASAGVWFRIGNQELTSSPGDIVIADADAMFEAVPISRYSDESWLLPKSMLDPHLPALAKPLSVRLSGRDGVEALAASYLSSLTRCWDSISVPDMAPVADTLARLVGIACGAAAEDQPDAVRAGRLIEVRRYIDRHLTDPDLSPAKVAAALGISVRALHLLFEPTGSSFSRHVLRRRLEQCRSALLADPARPVIDIAFAWGFGSLSGFYRAFQAAFGVSPGDLRTARGSAPRS